MYPVRVKEFDVSAEDEDPDWADIEPDPELALKVTDTTTHCAYSVRSAAKSYEAPSA